MLNQIHNALAPMHENESQTMRWIVRVIHMKIFTEGSLQLLLAAAQGLQGGTLYSRAKQFAFHFAAAQQPESERRAV